MSETEIVSDAPSEESSSAPVEQQTHSDKPAGYDPVDLSDLPEDKRQAVEDRIKYMYGQVKGNERALKEFREYKDIAAEQARIIEELQNGMGSVVEHLHTQEYAETESQIKAQMRQAHETGDTDAFIELNEKLSELKLEKKLQEKEKKTAPAQKSATPNTNSQSAISAEESSVIESWQQERDSSGNLIRPWAFDTAGEDYINALQEANVIFNSPKYRNLSVDKKLEKLDERLGVKKSTSSQTVMGGGFTTNNRGAKVIMTDKQKEIAVRTRYGGSKAKTDAEHIEAYRKQIEKVKLSNKGAR